MATDISPSASASRRHSSHVTRACDRCRRRKTRCSGDRPTCKNCADSSSVCVWSNEVDGRRTVATSHIERLQNRIGDLENERDRLKQALGGKTLVDHNEILKTRILKLERILAARGISVLEAFLDEGQSPGDSASPQTDSGEVSRDLETLKLDGESSLLAYGPSSALAHLAHAASQLPPVSTPPDSSAWAGWVEFDRHLPSMGLTSDQHEAILELFEAFFAPWCMVVDMDAFRLEMSTYLAYSARRSSKTRGSHYSPMLHNAILALGISFWRGDRVVSPFISNAAGVADPVEHAAEAFYRKAHSFFEEECNSPMLSTVRALLLMASFGTSRARANLGSRCSLTLGINIDASSLLRQGVISAEVKESRDSLFWTVWMQDRLWSLAMGRFAHLNASDYNIDPPVTRDEGLDETPWRAPRVWRDVLSETPELSAVGRSALRGSCQHALIQLGQTQDAIMQALYGLHSQSPESMSASDAASLQARLSAWLHSLPEAIKVEATNKVAPPPHVITLHLNWCYSVILLNRPFYTKAHNSPAFRSCVDACEESAARVIELIQLYDDVYSIASGPLSVIQTIWSAGTVFLLRAQSNSSRQLPIDSQLHSTAFCTAALRRIGSTWANGYRIAAILDNMARSWLPDADLSILSGQSHVALSPISKQFTPMASASAYTPPNGPMTEAFASYATPRPAIGFHFDQTWPMPSGSDMSSFDFRFSTEGINTFFLSSNGFS